MCFIPFRDKRKIVAVYVCLMHYSPQREGLVQVQGRGISFFIQATLSGPLCKDLIGVIYWCVILVMSHSAVSELASLRRYTPW